MTEIIRIECRPDSERKNLPSVRILDHDRAVFRVCPLHVEVQGLLGHELNVLVDGEYEILAGERLAFFAAKHMSARVQSGQHASRCAMQVFVEILLQAAQSVVVDAHVTKHLRGDPVIRIEALEFFLDIDTVQIQRFYLVDNRSVLLARNPCEVAGSVQARKDLLLRSEAISGIGVNYFCKSGGSLRPVRADFGGHGIDRVYKYRHRQLMQIAIVENAATRSHLKAPLLLLRGTLDEFLMAKDLQPGETPANQY